MRMVQITMDVTVLFRTPEYRLRLVWISLKVRIRMPTVSIMRLESDSMRQCEEMVSVMETELPIMSVLE